MNASPSRLEAPEIAARSDHEHHRDERTIDASDRAPSPLDDRARHGDQRVASLLQPANSVMIGPFERLTREQECARLLAQHRPDDFDAIAAALDRQFRTIHDRAHVLLQICAMLVSATILVTTGKLIVTQITTHLQRLVGYLLVGAGALVITAAGVIVGGVLSIRWITQQPGDDLGTWVMTILRYRDAKTVAYRVSIALVLASVVAFQSAIAIALVQI